MGDFCIEFEDKSSDSKVFGVYSGHVPLPDKHICSDGDKPFSRFFYIINGIFLLKSKDQNTIVGKKGDIIFLPNNATYVSEWTGTSDGDYISINFNITDESIKLPDHICLVQNDTNEVYLKYFQNMLSIWVNGNFGYKFKMLSELYRLLYHIYLNSSEKQIRNNHREIHKAILYIENHYLEDLSVKVLAKECCMGETQFHKLFKKYKNMPPITYRNYLRMQKAYEMLSSGEYNVTEAARAVNIPDLCYFNKLFKKTFQISPSHI